jgi:hypothetical protein
MAADFFVVPTVTYRLLFVLAPVAESPVSEGLSLPDVVVVKAFLAARS